MRFALPSSVATDHLYPVHLKPSSFRQRQALSESASGLRGITMFHVKQCPEFAFELAIKAGRRRFGGRAWRTKGQAA
jgi:hypothetical protein